MAESTMFPDWSTFTPEFASSELARLLEKSEEAVRLVEGDADVSYEGFIWKLDDATRELWRTWGLVMHLLGVMNSDEWRKVEETFQPKIVAFSLRVSQSPALYERAKAVRAALGADGDPVRARILDKTIQGAELFFQRMASVSEASGSRARSRSASTRYRLSSQSSGRTSRTR